MTKPRILVVEDEFVVAFDLSVALERMGYEVCGVVSSGEDAIGYAESQLPDCVLMDVGLNGEIDGIEAARQILARHGIRTAFLSGSPADEMLKRGADIRPFGCFVKPFDYDQLKAALGYFFSRRRGGDRLKVGARRKEST
jgi:DNA-binding response OmpR family regulator